MSSSIVFFLSFYIIINGGKRFYASSFGKACFKMIELTRIKGEKFALNSDQIEMMEETPDTIITMLNGHKYLVREKVKDIISAIESFRKNCSGPVVK